MCLLCDFCTLLDLSAANGTYCVAGVTSFLAGCFLCTYNLFCMCFLCDFCTGCNYCLAIITVSITCVTCFRTCCFLSIYNLCVCVLASWSLYCNSTCCCGCTHFYIVLTKISDNYGNRECTGSISDYFKCSSEENTISSNFVEVCESNSCTFNIRNEESVAECTSLELCELKTVAVIKANIICFETCVAGERNVKCNSIAEFSLNRRYADNRTCCISCENEACYQKYNGNHKCK